MSFFLYLCAEFCGNTYKSLYFINNGKEKESLHLR